MLIGWVFDIRALRSIRPEWAVMQANTALGLALSGIALWQLRDRALAGWASRMGQVCASAAAMIGLLTLAGYILGWHPGIDNLLFVDSSPMGPNTASALLFGNLALLLLTRATNRSTRLTAAGFLAILTLLLGLFGVVGYVGGVSVASAWGDFTGMAPHTALAFVILGAAGLRIAWINGGWPWSLGAPVVVGSTLGMLVLVGVSLESFRSTRLTVERSQWVDHTQEVRTVISDLNAGLASAFSGERGFVITGQEAFLASYTLGNRQALEAEQHLLKLTADNPRQQARLAQLAALLQQKLDFSRKVVEARRAG
ncbi:MAG: CHASE3 domain-containing protein, partial [Vicinamibacteria bacterium]